MHNNSRRGGIYSFFLISILLGTLYLAFLVLRPFVHIIIIGVVLATLVFPFYKKLLKRMPSRPSLASCIIVAGVVTLILVPFLFFSLALISQAGQSIVLFENFIKSNDMQALIQKHTDLAVIQEWLHSTIPFIDFEKIDLQSSFLNFSRRVGQWILDAGGKILSNAVGIIIDFALLIFVLFFLVRDGESMLAQIKRMSPLHDYQEEAIIRKVQDVSRSVVFGNFLIAILQGCLGGVGLAIAGLPAIFWGSIMAFTSLIPVVGTGLVWIPASIYLFITGSWGYGIFLLLWCGILVAGVDSVLRPLLLKGGVKMSTFYVFLSILGGIQFFGPLGILYGPMILALAMVMLTIYSREYEDILGGEKEKFD